MGFSLKKTLFFLALIFMGFLALSLFSGLEKNRFQEDAYSPKLDVELSIASLTFTQMDGPTLAWSLKADRAELQNSGKQALLQGVSVEIPYGQSSLLQVEGDVGQVDRENNHFSIWNEERLMQIALENEYTLSTLGLIWDEAQGEIVSKGRAEISGEGIKLEGELLRFAVDKEEMTLVGDVKALVY